MNEKPLWHKIAVITAIIILIGGLLAIIKWQHDVLLSQKETNITEMKQLRDDIVRAQSQYIDKKDLEEFAKNSNIDFGPIKEDLNKLNAQIKGISNIIINTPGYIGNNLSSTSVTNRIPDGSKLLSVKCPDGIDIECPDPFGYQTHIQHFILNEPLENKNNIPFGEVGFKVWEKSPWDLKIYPRSYSVTSVLGEDENGKHYTYYKFSIITNGQSYPIKITDAKFVEEKPEAKFRFSPRLYLATDLGTYIYPTVQWEISPNLQISLFSYGKTKVNPAWTFLGLGVGYGSQTKTITGILSPISYNIGQHLPFMQNLYIGPSIEINSTGGLAILAGLRVGL
jgi:hypothetical protein